jgi:UPF0755 protein
LALSRNLVKIVLGMLVALLGLAAWTGYELQRTLIFSGDFAEVRVAAGSTARGVALQLRAAGVPIRSWEFVLAATLTRTSRALRAGRYRIESQTNLLALLQKFRRGDIERVQLTIVDGSDFAELRDLIAQSHDLRHDTLGWSDAQILQALGATETEPEGLFAPDTYAIDPDASDLALYGLAYHAQQDRLEQAWQARGPDLPYATAYQALTMASIIEKETGRVQERPLVAAVFVNRQRLGMPLQTDPTVIYGLGADFSGRLHKRDLLRDTPYNTYTRAGLPPTPISLPGREAIEAALHPDPSPVLYFVARGDGTSEFSTTLADHNRAVARFQRSVAHHDAQ